MSLILEALKKSESQRRLGEAPNLGTPISATRRRRSPVPLLALGVLVAGGAAGWWWLQYAPAPESAEGSATANAGANGRDKAAHGTPVAADVAAGKRNDPRRAAKPRPTTTAPAADAAATVAAATPAAVPPPPAPAPPPAAPPAPVPQPKPAAGTTAAAPPIPPPATAAPASPPPAAVSPPAPAAQAALPDVQSINDLPYSVRKDLPDLPINMQVYSPDPARRFVIVGSERKIEGDAVKEVTLREIRPNGVVLEFHGQRFFLPRPGS